MRQLVVKPATAMPTETVTATATATATESAGTETTTTETPDFGVEVALMALLAAAMLAGRRDYRPLTTSS